MVMIKRRRKKTRGHQWTNVKIRKTTKKEVINWLDLPEEIMILIFMKLGPIDILLSAQKVCSSWRKVAYEPQLFRTVMVRHQELHYLSRKYICSSKFLMFFEEAFHRSCGQLVEVSCETLFDQELLNYVVSKPNSLKTLRIGGHSSYSVSVIGLISILKRLPLLEELSLVIGHYTKDLFVEIGLSCQKLRHLRVDYRSAICWKGNCEVQAFTIAKSMPCLHSLHLIGSEMSNKGLQAILAECPNLEYLDIRCCFVLTLEEDVLKELISRIRKVKLPNAKIRDLYPVSR